MDLGIQSDFFWAYAHMLDAIGELLSEVTTWGEGCPCHKRALEIRGVSRHVRGNQLADEIGQRVCPLRTCMAPACAAGELKDLLRTLLGRCNACLLVVPAMSVLSEQVERDVLNDFARARASQVQANASKPCRAVARESRSRRKGGMRRREDFRWEARSRGDPR